MTVFKPEETIAEKISASFERRIIHLENLMVVVCDFSNSPAPQPDPPHSHPHEQITYVAEGELFLFLGKEKYYLNKGDVFSVPRGVMHCIQTISPYVRLIDSFSPIREDFLKKGENQ
jgi:quercetin dioxygenase-like cupin family protein